MATEPPLARLQHFGASAPSTIDLSRTRLGITAPHLSNSQCPSLSLFRPTATAPPPQPQPRPL
ncbi:hypothetical protein HPP92_015619 [Vanilla planifolia]|uniref:Uncharacterized protein n=1 Tax=Vanilla planifolia TaxID=51239 RepID=A0A835QGL3_VANPL|nr:hypothetical protein HPP92_015619 [Vanilla planifolia]